MNRLPLTCFYLLLVFSIGCQTSSQKAPGLSAQDILGNPDYQAISYGGFRHNTREKEPTIDELKEDLNILSALGIKLIRTYYSHRFQQSKNLLQAIRELKEQKPEFEMYLMLGAWMECEGARTEQPNHERPHEESNRAEIKAAIELAQAYPEIVKIIAVGNESMVHWAESYYVHPSIILKEVLALQQLKSDGQLAPNLWITSSDNFASWGGGTGDYHLPELEELIRNVDYISMHTYPFHDTHYNSEFWLSDAADSSLEKFDQIDAAMLRAKNYAIAQYQSTLAYVKSLGIEKEIHIGETGWATSSPGFYGASGSKAADEYKQKHYYESMRAWTDSIGISCFFFEAFDEPWKDDKNVLGSENHFGLITINSEVKYLLWDAFDAGQLSGLMRNRKALTKTYAGNEDSLLNEIRSPLLIKTITN